MTIFKLTIFAIFSFYNLAFAKQDAFKEILDINANIVFVRHALAPGYGDPVNFNLKDCSTQRNLNSEGVNQARYLGNYFREQKILFSQIFTSQWCRCIETAKEMQLGNWLAIPDLNSFFQKHFKKSEIIDKLNLRLNSVKEGEIVLMITHQVVISEITQIAPPSGGVVIYNHKNSEAMAIDTGW